MPDEDYSARTLLLLYRICDDRVQRLKLHRAGGLGAGSGLKRRRGLLCWSDLGLLSEERSSC